MGRLQKLEEDAKYLREITEYLMFIDISSWKSERK